jgi:hypothetical protein
MPVLAAQAPTTTMESHYRWQRAFSTLLTGHRDLAKIMSEAIDTARSKDWPVNRTKNADGRLSGGIHRQQLIFDVGRQLRDLFRLNIFEHLALVFVGNLVERLSLLHGSSINKGLRLGFRTIFFNTVLTVSFGRMVWLRCS